MKASNGTHVEIDCQSRQLRLLSMSYAINYDYHKEKTQLKNNTGRRRKELGDVVVKTMVETVTIDV
jgi:hypothetical protein